MVEDGHVRVRSDNTYRQENSHNNCCSRSYTPGHDFEITDHQSHPVATITSPIAQPSSMDNSTFNSSSSNTTYSDWQSTQAPKSFWTNLTLPILYLTILIGSLYTFSTLYRKRQIANTAKLSPWFPRHRQRDVYLSLLHLDPAEASEGGDGEKVLKQVPDSVLKAALLRRALEDIQRILQLRTAKPALQTLLQRGSVGEELWQRFQRAEKEMEEEVKDVVNEV